MGAIADDYEYEERAAIRQLEAGFDEFEANQLALLDIKERRERREQKQKPVKQKRPVELPVDKKKAIDALREQARELRKKMKTAGDEQKELLFGEWMELQNKIIELRKQ